MGCACNKGRQARTADPNARVARDQEARAQTATSRIETPTPPKTPMQGRTQSFALHAGGKTAMFGSKLERDAAAVRTGGIPV